MTKLLAGSHANTLALTLLIQQLGAKGLIDEAALKAAIRSETSRQADRYPELGEAAEDLISRIG